MSEMSEIGKVLELTGQNARVKIESKKECFSCGQKAGCSVFKGKEWIIEARNEISAKTGDRVELALSGGAYVMAGMLVFLIPLFLMLLFYFISEAFFDGIVPVIVSFVGLGTGIAIAYFAGRGKGSEKYRYRIVRILDSDTESPEC